MEGEEIEDMLINSLFEESIMFSGHCLNENHVNEQSCYHSMSTHNVNSYNGQSDLLKYDTI